MEQYSFSSMGIFLPFISLIFGLATFVILLNLLMRVRRHLAIFIVWLLVADGVFIVRKVMFIAGFNSAWWWSILLQILDAAMLLPILLAVVEFSRLIRALGGEYPPANGIPNQSQN